MVQSISFCGLNNNLKIAKQEVKEFRTEFGHLKSDSFIKLKIYKHKNNPQYGTILAIMGEKAKQLGNLMQESYFTKYIMQKCTPNIPKKQIYKTLIDGIKLSKAANCQQQAEVLCHRLKQKGIKAKVVSFNIKNKATQEVREAGSHSFVVIDMKKGARISNPDAWGENAVILDTWSNINEPSPTGINYLKEIFAFNPETEFIEFFDSEKFIQFYKSKKFLRLFPHPNT